MKKCFYFLAIFVLLCNYSSKASPGDTTWVQANMVQMPGYGNYDTTIFFPSASAGVTYRKIYMIFTLGKYHCPGSAVCGEWDYTIDNYLMTPAGDTFDLGRLISPYADAGAPRTPWTWTQPYIYDVTDYVSALHDSATMRIAYSGYTGGFTANIRFAFIAGIPDRNVLELDRLWHGYWGYGDTAHSDSFDINSHLPTEDFTAPEGTVVSVLKYICTGHGSDNNNCNEFCNHTYYVYLNDAVIDSYAVWRSNCGSNELYPQSGTWLYQRANWCPGDIVYPQFYNLPGITGGAATNVDVRFQPYAGSGGAGYGIEGALFFYGPMNKELDASIDQIISPTVDENHFRENPEAGNPVIYVKNRGAAVINNITFRYGIVDSTMQPYTWYGTLDSMQGTEIVLPADLYQLNNIAGTPANDTFNYVVQITAVNGITDNDSTNNTMTSRFVAAPLWPSSFLITMKTNNESLISNPAVSETSWVIYDMYGNVVTQRSNTALSTLYIDSVSLPAGYYQLAVYDSGCDGLQWWVYTENPADFPGYESGYLWVTRLTGTALPLHGNVSGGTYNNDFGCGFTQSFSVGPLAQDAIRNISATNAAIDAYPNPAQNTVNIAISGLQQVKGVIQVMDALGRVVATVPCNSALQQINTGDLANGLYTIVFVDELEQNNRLTARLLIVR